MARRASSKLHPGLILAAIAVIGVAVFVGKSLIGKEPSGFGDVAKLRIEDLLENGNSLRGSQFVIEGQIDEKLQWTTGNGQLVSVRMETPGGDEFVGIEIPQEFNNLNIDVRQKYVFRVKFRQGGVPVATAVNRL